jgi:NADH dehydrogenase/NADH:ubiquinone oxidoreductase subunit G
MVNNLLNLTYIMKNGEGDHLNLLFLQKNLNSRGAWRQGLANRDIKTDPTRGLFLLLSDDAVNNEWLDWLKKIKYLVVQASYHSPEVDIANVVLPSPIWAERGGTYLTVDGRAVKANPVLERRYGILPDEETLQRLEKKMNKKPGRS